MFLLIYPKFTVTLGISPLSFRFFYAVCPWCICTDIAFAYISASFSASMRADVPCFSVTALARLRAISFRRLGSFSALFFLSPKAIHTLCILIDLHHPSKKCFPPIHVPKSLLKNSLCKPDTAIDGPGPSMQYSGWPKIVDALGLINLFTMDPLALPQALSTLVANNVSKLSIINAFGEGSFPTFSLMCSRRKIIFRIHPWP